MEPKKKIYFAHPVADYGKKREAVSLQMIKNSFPDDDILNPNQPEHAEAYKASGMKYFEELVLSCDILVAVAFEDGEWGMGVWREAETVANNGGKVYQLRPEGGLLNEVDFKNVRPLSINETRRRIKAAQS